MKANNQENIKEISDLLWILLGGHRLPFDIIDKQTGEIFVPAGRPVLHRHCKRIAELSLTLDIETDTPQTGKR